MANFLKDLMAAAKDEPETFASAHSRTMNSAGEKS